MTLRYYAADHSSGGDAMAGVPRQTRSASIVLSLLAAACAPRHEVASHVSHRSGPPAAYATIVSVRPVAGGGARGTILGVLGGGMAASQAGPAVSEFIVRDAAGRTLSVVQANSEGFRAGEHVVLIVGVHTRLARQQAADGAGQG
jgi:outer membrane lipoprotein SlyB